MSSQLIKDKFLRSFSFYEKQLFKLYIGTNIKKTQVFIRKKAGISLLKNHCVFTFRSRSVFKFFKCSRIFLRMTALSGGYAFIQKKSFLSSFIICSYGEMVDTVDSNSTAFLSVQVQILLRVYLFLNFINNDSTSNNS